MNKVDVEGCEAKIEDIPTVGAFFPYVIYAAPVLNRYLQQYFVPIEGKIVSLGLAKPNPHEDIYISGLSK